MGKVGEEEEKDEDREENKEGVVKEEGGEEEAEVKEGDEEAKEMEEAKEGNKKKKVVLEEVEKVVEVCTALSVEHSTSSSLSCSSRLTVAASTLINIFEGPLTFDLHRLLLCRVCACLLLLCDGGRQRN